MSTTSLPARYFVQESLPTPPPSAPESTAQRLSEAASEFFMQPTVEATMEAIVRNAVEILQASDAALITSRRSSLDIGVSTTERARKVDWFQFKLSEGPCLTAVQDHTPIVVQDISGEPRWPSWAQRAAEVGFRSMVAVPLALQPSHAAALSVYWDRPARLRHEHVAVAALIARHASIAVDTARRSSTLQEAIDARHQIGLAQGILMEQFGLDAQQSFGVLRRYSRDNNIKLRKIAAEVVATRSLPGTTTVRKSAHAGTSGDPQRDQRPTPTSSATSQSSSSTDATFRALSVGHSHQVRPLPLPVTRHVGAAAETQRPGYQGLQQGGLAGSARPVAAPVPPPRATGRLL